VSLLACGAAPPPPKVEAAPVASAAPEAEEPEEKPTQGLPTACAGERTDKLCLPPAAFAQRLCASAFPDAALAMFAKGTPWSRAYLRGNTEAWNASGGASSADKLVFDEEVLIVVHREVAAGGMTVSGASGSYDVLRWDGTCASLSGEEVTTKLPPAPKSAKIPWRILSDALQNALRADEKVSRAVTERKKECHGVTVGDVSIKCVKTDVALSLAIADAVRKGVAIPAPTKLP
jgi:hypothetical protein